MKKASKRVLKKQVKLTLCLVVIMIFYVITHTVLIIPEFASNAVAIIGLFLVGYFWLTDNTEKEK